jgi:hypothetical protein
MQTVNSVSGGKTSAYIAAHFPADYEVFSLVCIDDERCRIKDPSINQYINAKLEKFIPKYGEFIATAEDDATLYAMRDLEQFIGREIIWVRGQSFDNVIDKKGTHNTKRDLIPNKHFRYCTEEMKLIPIFYWWFHNLGQRVKMRIGFRFDEFDRIERFLNDQKPNEFKIPVSCSMKGQRQQKHEIFNWRFCTFPLAKHGITEAHIKEYWRKNGYVGGNLFEERRQIVFPVVSNCVGCFHKKPDTLSIMAAMHPEKMNWFAEQEDKDMGTWLDSKIPYRKIIENSNMWIPEMLKEIGSCDSGGCHD